MKLFEFLLLLHFCGDFIFQNTNLANQKKLSVKKLCLHALIYTACFLPVLVLNRIPLLFRFLMVAAIALSHFFADWLRTHCVQKKKPATQSGELVCFLLDQGFHIFVLVITAWLAFGTADGLSLNNWLPRYGLATFAERALPLMLIYIFCSFPAAVLIKKILAATAAAGASAKKKETAAGLNRAGFIIGVLERFLILSLCLVGSTATIGFVLAAKSVARFKQLEDESFAEKYLIGTLLSTLIAFLCSIVYPYL